LIRFTGTANLVRFLLSKNRISIVLYHNPKPDIFEKHLSYLSKKYNIIPLSKLIDAIDTNNFKDIPKYALIVTIDDGWKENYELLPVIKKYKFKPTVFLTSHIIDTERHFWWTKCKNGEAKSLKNVTNTQRLKTLNEKYQYHPDKEYAGDRQALNRDEIERMKEVVDFGIHTCYHPVLIQCSLQEKKEEILESKSRIENILGHPVYSFSYPNGNYDNDCIDILKECGIKVARTTDAGWNSKRLNKYMLKVTGVSDHSSKNKLIAELTGIPMFLQYLFIGSFNGTKTKSQ
jgi:peptidoglycan/xylan/chitin deacetylase (PgdA/CDA1 family)